MLGNYLLIYINYFKFKNLLLLTRDKFRRHNELREKLKATEKRELINTFEEMTTSNIFWGVVDGK